MTPAQRLSTSLPAAVLLTLFSLTLGAPDAGGDPEPAADFDYDVAVGPDERDVTFTDISTVPAPLSRLWDFGDGSVSTSPAPVHTYGDAGLYDVTLTVTDGMGTPHSVTRPVGVGDRLVVDGFESPSGPVDWDVVGPVTLETLAPVFGLQSVSVPGDPAQVPVVICSGTFGVLDEAYVSVAVDPSGLTLDDGGSFKAVTLVDGGSAGTAVAAVKIRNTDEGPELRIWARDAAGQRVQSSYVAVADLMDQAWIFDVHWRAQTPEAQGSMSLGLYDLQGAPRLSVVLESFDNTGVVFDYVRLGIDTGSLPPSTAGALLLDRFELRRFSAVPVVD